MRALGLGSFDLALPTGRRDSRQLAFDAADRRAVFAKAVLRLATDDDLASVRGEGGESQTRATIDADDGHRGVASSPANDATKRGTSSFSVPFAGCRDRPPQSGLVERHHLRADAARLHVLDGGARLVQPLRLGVAIVEQFGGNILPGGS